MKKLQLAHSELTLRQASVPDIRVINVSSPTKTRKHVDLDKPEPRVADVNRNIKESHHIPLPLSPVDLKNHLHPLKATQSHGGAHHPHTIAEQGKHVYHSEPANLNGYRSAPACCTSKLFDLNKEMMFDEPRLFPGTPRTARVCRLEFVLSCRSCLKLHGTKLLIW